MREHYINTRLEVKIPTPPAMDGVFLYPKQTGGINKTIMLTLIPISLALANAFVAQHHRHHQPVVGHKYSIGCALGSRLIGVAITGRPVSRYLDDGTTLEVTRLCTDGTPNACSILYAASARAAKAMGYAKIISHSATAKLFLTDFRKQFRFTHRFSPTGRGLHPTSICQMYTFKTSEGGTQPYQTNNLYAALMRQAQMEREVKQIVRKTKKAHS